jgi:hypothetical protein
LATVLMRPQVAVGHVVPVDIAALEQRREVDPLLDHALPLEVEVFGGGDALDVAPRPTGGVERLGLEERQPEGEGGVHVRPP